MLYLPCFQNWQMSLIPWWYYRNELSHLKDRQSRNPSELRSHWRDNWMNELFPLSSMKKNLIFPFLLFHPSSFVGQNISEVVLTPEPPKGYFQIIGDGTNLYQHWQIKMKMNPFFLSSQNSAIDLINSAIIHICKLRDLKLLNLFFRRLWEDFNSPHFFPLQIDRFTTTTQVFLEDMWGLEFPHFP